jgi:nitrite reductase (NADH) large subunit
VDESEILLYLKKGASSTVDIQEFTRAGTSCGRCLPEIDQLVADFNKKKPGDVQGKLFPGQ